MQFTIEEIREAIREVLLEETDILEEARKKRKKSTKRKKGPSKKTAQKILKGTETFADKMKRVSGWADNPAAAAAWMMHKATGKWPSEK